MTPLPHLIAMKYFREGEEAFDAETPQDACPYQMDSPEGIHWCSGWDMANEENEVLISAEREDARLDGRYS